MARSETEAGGAAVVWFREDLRLADNPALTQAAATGRPVVGLYILDLDAGRGIGGARRWWLHTSLERLAADLSRHGVPLVLRAGPEAEALPAFLKEVGADAVFWNRRYDKTSRETDTALKADLKARGLKVESGNGHLLVEPWEVEPRSGGSFKVFTPFWKAARASLDATPALLPVPRLPRWPGKPPKGVALDALKLLPTRPDWAGGLRATWTPGEAGARERLERFIEARLSRYAAGRDVPSADAVSMLSPHLRHGEISARTVLHAVEHAGSRQRTQETNVVKFAAELGWREFSYHLLYHFPDLATRNFQPRFDAFDWRGDTAADLAAWQRGRTGYPIVDAGMRQLWATGFMHNRVRMIVASFLVKHLLIDWRVGEDWFFDTLCDADPASNAASWQWVAGSGADAAPYFRVFNPVLQGEKFDPDGKYVREWVPELADLSPRLVHKPWTADGPHRVAYPAPIVDHAAARDRALAAFGRTKAAA